MTFWLFLLGQNGILAQTAPTHTTTGSSIRITSTSARTTASSSTASAGSPSSITTATIAPIASDAPPDVLLRVPNLSVQKIQLIVENLQADINLNADVAGLVQINAGVAVSVQTINVTITDVEVELELIVRLGNLVNIVNRVFQSLDLNPLLINVLNDVTSVVDTAVGAVDGLLGTITQGGGVLSFIIDNLGNIVQETVGGVDTIVGNYLQNMTFTGVEQTLQGGQTQKQYLYGPLNALVNIIFNSAGQIVSAVVDKSGASGGGSSSSSVAGPTPTSSSSVAPSSTATGGT